MVLQLKIHRTFSCSKSSPPWLSGLEAFTITFRSCTWRFWGDEKSLLRFLVHHVLLQISLKNHVGCIYFTLSVWLIALVVHSRQHNMRAYMQYTLHSYRTYFGTFVTAIPAHATYLYVCDLYAPMYLILDIRCFCTYRSFTLSEHPWYSHVFLHLPVLPTLGRWERWQTKSTQDIFHWTAWWEKTQG